MSGSLLISRFRHKEDARPRPIEVTFEQLARKLKRPEVRTEKDGPGWSPASFKGSRANDHVENLSCLVLDYDGKATWDDATRRFKSLGYTFAAHTTHSHQRVTGEHPAACDCFRVILLLAKPIPRNEFAKLWNWAFEFTDGLIDPTPKDPARLYYWPAKATEDSPFLFEEHKGKPLDWEAIIENIPADKPAPGASSGSAYGRAALKKELALVDEAPIGERNTQLFKSAARLGELIAGGELKEGVVIAALHKVAELRGLTSREIDKTIQSGLSRGGTAPRQAPEVIRKDETPVELPVREWPRPLGEDAYLGIAGEFVRLIEKHTEADPAALLLQFLAGFGSIAGRGAYFPVEADRHHTNLFLVLVGNTSKARKGTSHNQALRLLKSTDPDWKAGLGGFGSGEGLIWAVRDAIEKLDPKKQEMVIIDHGVGDKRLLVSESEFTGILKVAGRDGSTLSEVIRKAWDTGDLHNPTKGNPGKATGAHISIIGHITRDELIRTLEETDKANGFANRFLWCCVRRARLLPEGGSLREDDLIPISGKIAEALVFARGVEEMRRDPDARQVWRDEYAKLSEGKPGMLGAITSRAEAQVTRLSLIYALLDKSAVVYPYHLRAALEVWRYCEDSARYIFGDSIGDRIADTIFAALRESGEQGLTQTEIYRDVFKKNHPAAGIARALSMLVGLGRVRQLIEPSDQGKGTIRWVAVL